MIEMCKMFYSCVLLWVRGQRRSPPVPVMIGLYRYVIVYVNVTVVVVVIDLKRETIFMSRSANAIAYRSVVTGSRLQYWAITTRSDKRR